MSYRALVSLICEETAAKVDFLTYLGEDWKNGEEFAHAAGAMKTFHAALACGHTKAASTMVFASEDERQEWIKTWADQLWEVRFRMKDGYAEVLIEGFDAGDMKIFMRRTCYYVGEDAA